MPHPGSAYSIFEIPMNANARLITPRARSRPRLRVSCRALPRMRRARLRAIVPSQSPHLDNMRRAGQPNAAGAIQSCDCQA